MRRERRNGVIMSESYAVNEKRELILQKVKEFIVAHGGIVKKNQLEELHIDYRRILDFVEKGDLIRIKSGYYTIRIGDYSEDELIDKIISGRGAYDGVCIVCVWLYQKKTIRISDRSG